jgi:hypothetical protein
MVSSGTGQMPIKPSQGVLFLLQRNGLMAVNQSASFIHIMPTKGSDPGFLQGAASDYIFRISILVAHASCPALGAIATISPNGRGGQKSVSDRILPISSTNWGNTRKGKWIL